jgi:D-aminoacyl-tRNA deacylase
MSGESGEDGPVRVLLSSRPDTASQNIRERVLESSTWESTRFEFDGAPVLRLVGPSAPLPVLMAQIRDWHITREGIGEELQEALGPVESIMVLSRHRAASGKPSLTVHPVGNPGSSADAGGTPRMATPTQPHLLAAAYRALSSGAKRAGLEHGVSLEATHHGPLTKVPLLFIEVGSSEEHWGEPEPGRVVAEAALEAVRHVVPQGTRTIMGIGGPHYAPRLGAILDESDVSLGHMVADYHFKGEADPPSQEVLKAFIDASVAPGEKSIHGVYVDRKSLPGPQRRRVLEDLEALGVRVVRTNELVA